MNLKSLKFNIYILSIFILLSGLVIPGLSYDCRVIKESEDSYIFNIEDHSPFEWQNKEFYPDSVNRLLIGDTYLTPLSDQLLIPYQQFNIALPTPTKPNIQVTNMQFEQIVLEKALETDDFQRIRDLPLVEVTDIGFLGRTPCASLRIYPLRAGNDRREINILRSATISVQFSRSRQNVRYQKVTGQTTLADEISFINPNLAKNWKYQRIIPMKKPSTYPSGVWIKITVTEDGIYSIPFEQIKALGIINENIDTNQIFLYSNSTGGFELDNTIGADVPENLVEISRKIIGTSGRNFGPGDTLIFWGRSTSGIEVNSKGTLIFKRNCYSLENYYWLFIADNPGTPNSMAEIPPSTSGQSDRVTDTTEVLDRHEIEASNFLHSGKQWYGEKFSGSGSNISIIFTPPESESTYPAHLNVRTVGATENSHFFDLYVNGATNPATSWSSTNYDSYYKSVSTTLKPGTTNYFLIRYRGSVSTTQAFLDYFECNYEAELKPGTEPMRFWAPVAGGTIEYQLSGVLPKRPIFFDITDWANVAIQKTEQTGTYTFKFQASSQVISRRSYYVTSPEKYKNPKKIERIDNVQWNTLRNQNVGTKYVIITDKAFQSAADDLADLYVNDLRETDRLSTKVVFQSQIFREFNGDIPDPHAIRFFLKHAFENWTVAPEYVLLLGDGTFDYRGIESKQGNFIFTYQVESGSPSTSYASDAPFVYVNGSDKKMDMAIGRIPAKTPQEAQNVADKIRKYLLEPVYGPWRNQITLMADDPERPKTNEEYHIADTEDYIARYIPKNFTINKLYLLEFPEVQDASTYGVKKPAATDALLTQLEQGTTIINYFGHGSSTLWAQEQVLEMERDLANIHTDMKLPFWIAATCSWGQFDDISGNCMPEALILEPDDGGIAALGATRATYPSENRAFISALFQKWFLTGKINRIRLGNLMQIVFSGNSENNEKYIFFGDPALYLALPYYQVNFDKLTSDTLKALANVSASGSTLDFQDYSGEGFMRVFDSDRKVTRTYLNAAKQLRSMSYILPGELLFKGSVPIKSGKFSSSFFIPKDLNYENRFGSINLYSWDKNGLEVSGYYDSLVFQGSEAINDTVGPIIKIGFQDRDKIGFQNPDFRNGDIITLDVPLLVEIEDEHGINITGQLGHGILVEFDSDEHKVLNVTENFSYDNDSDTSGILALTLPELEPGEHSVCVKAWDNANNMSTAELSFSLSLAEKMKIERAVNFPNPFSDETDFTMTLTQQGFVKISIYTIRGLLIKTIESPLPPGFHSIHWDGKDDYGDNISRGIYIYKVKAKSIDSKQTDTFIGKIVKAK